MPRRKRSAWGSVRERRRGVWEVRYTADMRDGRGYRQVSETVRGTRRQAEELRARRQLEHSGDAPCPTLGQCWEMWLLPELERSVAEGRLAPRTLENYLSRWSRHVQPDWGREPLSGIRGMDVQSWLDGKTAKMAKDSLALCQRAVDYAVRYDLVGFNVFRREYVMPTASGRRDGATWGLRECVAVERELRGTRAWAAFAMLAFAGCRPGEAKAVTADKVSELVDPATGAALCAVEIDDEVSGRGEMLSRLKNESSFRTAIVPPPWAGAMMALKAERERDGLPFMSDRGDGRPLTTVILKADLERAAAAAGVRPIPAKNLRNSWRTWMRDEAGLPGDLLEKLMGHKGSTVTERHYYRPMVESAAAEVARAFADARFRDTYGILWDGIDESAGR